VEALVADSVEASVADSVEALVADSVEASVADSASRQRSQTDYSKTNRPFLQWIHYT
jgi:hypothetical protein